MKKNQCVHCLCPNTVQHTHSTAHLKKLIIYFTKMRNNEIQVPGTSEYYY